MLGAIITGFPIIHCNVFNVLFFVVFDFSDSKSLENQSVLLRGGFRRGTLGSVEPPLIKNLNFHGNFWIKLINFGYRFYFKYSHSLNLLVEIHFTAFEYL